MNMNMNMNIYILYYTYELYDLKLLWAFIRFIWSEAKLMCQVQNAGTAAEFRRHRCEDWERSRFYGRWLVFAEKTIYILYIYTPNSYVRECNSYISSPFSFAMHDHVLFGVRTHEMTLPTTGSSEALHSAPFSARVARANPNWWRSQLVHGDITGDGLQSWKKIHHCRGFMILDQFLFKYIFCSIWLINFFINAFSWSVSP